MLANRPGKEKTERKLSYGVNDVTLALRYWERASGAATSIRA